MGKWSDYWIVQKATNAGDKESLLVVLLLQPHLILMYLLQVLNCTRNMVSWVYILDIILGISQASHAKHNSYIKRQESHELLKHSTTERKHFANPKRHSKRHSNKKLLFGQVYPIQLRAFNHVHAQFPSHCSAYRVYSSRRIMSQTTSFTWVPVPWVPSPWGPSPWVVQVESLVLPSWADNKLGSLK